jgi:4-carboxymuconolactone decarboxylase
MTEQPQTAAQRLVGDIAPALATLTDDVLFGDIWERTGLAQRDRSLITCAALITNGNTAQLKGHLARALDNGVTPDEIIEMVTHLAFYAGWPRAMSAVPVAREVFSASGAAR